VATSIDPFKKKVQAPPAPVDKEKQNALLERVTGAQKKPVLPTPPPAKPVPGITGNPPLPAGKLVGHIAPSSLTDIERQSLEAAGWTADIALPSTPEGLKQLQAEIARMDAIELPLPTAKPVIPPTVPLSSLSAEKRGEITNALKGITSAEAQKAQQAKQQSKLLAAEGKVEGILGAVSAADQAVNAFYSKLAKGNEEHVYEVEIKDPEPVQAEPAISEPVAPTSAKVEKSKVSETGADAHLTHCPHCQWDLSVPDVTEPSYADKLSFLHCLLGEQMFTKKYPLFDGNVEVTFRTLTTREVDVIYKQAYLDRQEGKIPNEVDYWERLNRYRLMLQLQAFRSLNGNGFYKDLPDGYSKATNPQATGVWVNTEREAELQPNETGIPAIETWIVDEVLRTEGVFRVVNNLCNQFNRLVIKMEAMADNSDFWKPTEEPY